MLVAARVATPACTHSASIAAAVCTNVAHGHCGSQFTGGGDCGGGSGTSGDAHDRCLRPLGVHGRSDSLVRVLVVRRRGGGGGMAAVAAAAASAARVAVVVVAAAVRMATAGTATCSHSVAWPRWCAVLVWHGRGGGGSTVAVAAAAIGSTVAGAGSASTAALGATARAVVGLLAVEVAAEVLFDRKPKSTSLLEIDADRAAPVASSSFLRRQLYRTIPSHVRVLKCWCRP